VLVVSMTYITGLVFISVILLVLGFYQPAIAEQLEFARRISRILRKDGRNDAAAGAADANQFAGRLYRALQNVVSATPVNRWIGRELTRADLPLRSEEFLAFSVLGIGPAGFAILFITGNLLYFAIALVILLPLPYLFIMQARHKRLAQLNSQIGDALLIIANALRSGFSFMQAMSLVRKEMPDPIAREFGRAFQEISLGTPTDQALLNMAERVGSDDLDMVVTAVLIQRQVGGNLAEVLDKIAHTIRERIRIKGEIKTLTAQGRVSGLIVGLLPTALALVMYLMSPEYISLLFTTRVGLVMVGIAFLMQTTGFLIIRRMVDIKY
jgi:tight adherence protein B